MKLTRIAWTIPGQWITALVITPLLIGPAACQTGGLPFGNNLPTINPSNPFGLIINSNPASDVLGGIRLESGETVFAYGTFKSDGTVEELTAIALTDGDGNESSIEFELGRPKRGMAFDGSGFEITYDEVSEKRLAGNVKLNFAGVEKTQTVPFDVDLEATARQIQDAIDQFTGITIDPPVKPEEPKADGNRDRSAIGDKNSRNEQVILIALPFFQFAFALTGFSMLLIMSQVMAAVSQALIGVVAAITQTVIAAAFAPFILMGNILQGVFRLASISLDLTVNLPAVVVPPRPRVTFNVN